MQIHRSVPLSDQVNEVMRDRIRQEVYPPGGRLPSEAELSEEFGVSRATVRTVLTRLAGEGLIIRKQGDGTYVNERIRQVNTHLGGLWEFERLIETSGYTARIQPLDATIKPANPTEAQALGVPVAQPLLALTRLFYAGEDPAILAVNVVSKDFVQVPLEDIDGQLGIKLLLERYCQQRIAFAITEVRAQMSDPPAAEKLQIPVGVPLLGLQVTFFNRDNQAIAFGRSLVNDELLQLRLVQAWS